MKQHQKLMQAAGGSLEFPPDAARPKKVADMVWRMRLAGGPQEKLLKDFAMLAAWSWMVHIVLLQCWDCIHLLW